MKWLRYVSPTDGEVRLGLIQGDVVLGCRQAGDLLALLGDDAPELADAARATIADPLECHELGELVLQAPIPVPPSIRDFMAFEDHIVPILAAQGRHVDPAWYEIPAFYFTNPAAVLGPNDDVLAAPGGQQLDFELEVAAVVGRTGRDLTPPKAEAHIAGYLLMSDWSARDLQRLERGIGLGPTKGKDWATTFGPVFVTADELEPRRKDRGFDVGLRAAVNGVPYSDGNLAELYWSFGEMISYASRGTEVRAGDVIGSGTVGTGCIADLAARHGSDRFPWLVPGDQIRIEAELLGVIDCTLVAGPDVVPLRPQLQASCSSPASQVDSR
jgi:2-keto-4-pentenoate hydratase/2-oxohepta-3-ene-1,7-dioic acid hydratase in catechol pathway